MPPGKITIRFVTGRSIVVNAMPTDTILALKMRIEAAAEGPHDQHCLLSFQTGSSRKLKDNCTLASRNIRCDTDSIVYCVNKHLRGGGLEVSPLPFSFGSNGTVDVYSQPSKASLVTPTLMES